MPDTGDEEQDYRTIKISLAAPQGLLKRVDRLAKLNYTSRSDILRQALLEYTRKPENNLDLRAEQAELNLVRVDFPDVDPNDIELLWTLRKLNNKL